jgi:putative ABC transport system permease protein
MFTHYLKIAFRNMRKHKAQSLTGIFGLAFGLACFVPALCWLRCETSYDGFYPGAEDIYRVYIYEKQSGKLNERVSGILERKMHEQYAATENSTIFFSEQNDCSAGEMPHIRLRMVYTDSAFFGVFPQTVVSGNARQPLEVANNIVLTESTAVRMFGDVETAIGQTVKSTVLTWFPPYTVTAVVEDPPANTNVPFDAILFFGQVTQHKTITETSAEQIWGLGTLQMYVKFHPDTDVDGLAAQLRDFPSRLDAGADRDLRMMPIRDVRHRLNPEVPFTLNFIRLFVAAGILMLFSALFNFLNLHLDIFRRRVREFRQRAVHGAGNMQLIAQMTFELACAVLLALALAGCFVILARPVFSGLPGITVGMSQLLSLFAVCAAGVMALMLLAGLIPFWRLSRRATCYRSKVTVIGGQPALRRMAVGLQLAVSVAFIVAALVVMMQMRFVDRKDPGFERDGMIHLSGLSWYTNDDVITALKNELASIPQIEAFTDAYFEPQHSVNTETVLAVEWPGKLPSDNSVFQGIATDSRFAETFGVTMLAGKWLDDGAGKDKIVINEEAARVMGLSEAVGTVVRIPNYQNPVKEYTVAGVVKDFHTLSLRNRIHPTVFFTSTAAINNLYVRVAPGQEQEAIRRIRAILPEINTTLSDVSPTPLVELYDRLNYSEKAGLKMFAVLAAVCLLISLFGIYAVATAATRRRRREIAIRKVFGAEAGDILRMFFGEYALQVVIAGAVALPLAYLAMSRWLQGYAYRTDIPWWLPAGVIAGVVAVVLLTVLGQVLKAAGSNPAEVVKSE